MSHRTPTTATATTNHTAAPTATAAGVSTAARNIAFCALAPNRWATTPIMATTPTTARKPRSGFRCSMPASIRRSVRFASLGAW